MMTTYPHLCRTIAGGVFVFYLVFAEVYIGAICPACTVVHVLSLGALYLAKRMVGAVLLSLFFVFRFVAPCLTMFYLFGDGGHVCITAGGFISGEI